MNLVHFSLMFAGVIIAVLLYRVVYLQARQRGEVITVSQKLMTAFVSLTIGLIPLATYEKFYGWHDRVPLSYEAVRLDGKQWNHDEYQLAGRITIKRLEKLYPQLEDAQKRQDFGALLAVADPVTQTLMHWNDQQDSDLKATFSTCRLAQAKYLGLALDGGGSSELTAYLANLDACKAQVGW